MNYDTKLIIQPSVLTSMSPMFLTQKLQFCNFHAVFGYCVQIPPQPVTPISETLNCLIGKWN